MWSSVGFRFKTMLPCLVLLLTFFVYQTFAQSVPPTASPTTFSVVPADASAARVSYVLNAVQKWNSWLDSTTLAEKYKKLIASYFGK